MSESYQHGEREHDCIDTELVGDLGVVIAPATRTFTTEVL